MADETTKKQIDQLNDVTDRLADTADRLSEGFNKLGQKMARVSNSAKDMSEYIEDTVDLASLFNKKIEAQKNMGKEVFDTFKKITPQITDQVVAVNKQVQALGRLRERGDQVYGMQIKVEDALKKARASGSAEEISKLVAKKKQLDNMAEFNLQEIRDGDLKLANLNLQLGMLKNLESAYIREMKLRQQIIGQLQIKKKITKEIDSLLSSSSEEYKKIKQFIGDIASGGATMYLALIKASLERWKELDAAVGNFRDKTGMLVTQTVKLYDATREVNTQLSHLGVGITEAYAAAEALTNQFQVIGLVTKDSVKNLAMMAVNLGISVTDAAKFKGTFESIAKSTGYTSEDIMMAGAKLAEMGGVAPAAVMKDMAEASAETLMFLSKSPMQLVKASVEARRLGTTVNSLAKSARGLLNFQESITDELSASALIGKSLNFQGAREAAYAGDVVKSRQLALKEIAKAGDFTKLNVYQQEALAKAAGMTVEEIIKQQNQQKMLEALKNSANAEDRRMFADYEAMTKKMQEDEKAAAKDLVARGRDMAKQQLRQTEMNKLANAFKSIWTDITDSLLGIASVVMPPIIFAARLIGFAFKIIGGFVRGLLSPLIAIGKLLGLGGKNAGTWESIFSSIGDIIEKYVVPGVEYLGMAIGWTTAALFVLFKGFGVLALLTTRIGWLSRMFTGLADIIFMIKGTVGRAFLWMATKVNAFGAAISSIGKLFKPIGTAIEWLGGKLAALGRWLQGGMRLGSILSAISNGILNIGLKIGRLGQFVSSLGKPFEVIGRIITWIGLKIINIGRYIADVARNGGKLAGIFGKIGQVASSIWNTIRGWFGAMSKGTGILGRIGQVASSIWNTIRGWVSATSKGINIFGRIGGIIGKIGSGISKVWSFAKGLFSVFGKGGQIISKVWNAAKGLFSVFGKGGGILSKVLGIFSRIGLTFLKAIPGLGWIITGVQTLYEWGKKLFSIWTDDNLSIGEKIWKSIVALPEAIFDALVSPFIDLGAMVLKLFGVDITEGTINSIKDWGKKIFKWLLMPWTAVYDLASYLFGDGIGEKIVDGLKSAGTAILDALMWPFKKIYEWFTDDSGLAGKSPSKIGTMMVDGIKSIGSLLFDALTWPFRAVMNFVSSIFGGDGDLGTTIVNGIKGISEFVYDMLVSPFKKLISFAQKIPFIGKLFGGDDSAAEASRQAVAQVESKGPAVSAETQTMGELKESINGLATAISDMSSAIAPTVNVNNNNEAVIAKLDELITLLSEGAIAINIDGVKVSKELAKTA